MMIGLNASTRLLTSVCGSLLIMGFCVTLLYAQSDSEIHKELGEIKKSLDNQRHINDQLLKQIDDLLWYQRLGDLVDIDKVRYPGAERYQPNRTAQDVGNALIISAYTFMPRNLDRQQKYPLLVFVHGGVHNHFGTRYVPIVRELIEQGYVIVAPEYRGSKGYGARFYNQIDYGGSEIEDVYLGGEWMLEQYAFIDRNRVGILGWSHGGFISLWNIFKYPGRYKVAFAGVPVTNLALRAGTKARGASGYPVEDYGAPSGIGASAFDNIMEYVRRSPAYNADKLQTPLLIHGATNDSDVNIFEVEQLVDALKARGKKFEYKSFQAPPGEHSFEFLDTALAKQARLEIYRFLAGYLKPPNPPRK